MIDDMIEIIKTLQEAVLDLQKRVKELEKEISFDCPQDKLNRQWGDNNG